jgi:predicted RNA-binding Zn-ribbon protein involved in translation (DUF1610 family)
MNIHKYLELANKYNDCPKCGNNYIGNGEGKLIVEDDVFYRSCKCGWEIEIKVDKLE